MMDSQNFYSLSAADPERLTQNGESSQAGRSQDDAIYIEDCDSDDDETYVSGDDQIDDPFPSVYDLICPTAEHRDAGFGSAPVNLDNGQSNTVSPSVNELRLLNLGRDSNTGADMGLDATFPTTGEEGLRELSLNEIIEPADKVASSQQQKTDGPERPLLPPSTSLISNEGDAGDEVTPSREQEAPVQEHSLMPSSGPLWLRQSPMSEAPQGTDSEDTIRNRITHELHHATPTRVEMQAAPSPDQLAKRQSPQLYGEERQDSPTCHNLASESDDNVSTAELLRTKPKSRLQKRVAARLRFRGSGGTCNKDRPSKDDTKAVYQKESQYLADHRRHDTADVEGEDVYGSEPSTYGERDQDDKDDDDFYPPPLKRQKKNPSIRTTSSRAAKTRRSRSNGRHSRERRVQTLTPNSSRRYIRSPPSSQGSDPERELAETHATRFEEKRLSNSVLKIVTEHDRVTYQLEWSEDFSELLCTNHRPENDASRSQRCIPTQSTKRSLANDQGKKNLSCAKVKSQDKWDVQEILASRVCNEQLQYQVDWADWEDDDKWYLAEGFKGCPQVLHEYHDAHPEMPGPPARLVEWLRACKYGREAPYHPDDNKLGQVALH